MQKSWNIGNNIVSLCKNKESWSGSYYELSMGYEIEGLKKQKILHLMQWLWNDSSLLGTVKSPDLFGAQWQHIDISFLTEEIHFYGCIRFPNGQIIGCGSLYTVAEGVIWITLYIPLSMLSLIFPVHYPVTREKNLWITWLDQFLGMIGSRVYRDTPFLLAVMGEEATAFPLKNIMANITHEPGLLIPETTFRQASINPYGTCLSEGLWWTGG